MILDGAGPRPIGGPAPAVVSVHGINKEGIMFSNLKMYVFVKDSVPLGFAMAAVGHAVLALWLKFKDDPDMQKWEKESFKKVVCRVPAAEFDQLKGFPKNVVMTESALKGADTAVAFCPREEWPLLFKKFPLYM